MQLSMHYSKVLGDRPSAREYRYGSGAVPWGSPSVSGAVAVRAPDRELLSCTSNQLASLDAPAQPFHM